ncbi:MAG: serpin family protein [Bradymonadaceae bacterium]
MMAFPSRILFASLLTLGLAACGPAAPGTPDDNNETNNQANNQPEPVGNVLRSELNREANPDVDAETRAELSAGNRDFAFDLFAQLRLEEGDDANIFVSPHSISLAMAMAYGGALNQTKSEMADVLRFTLADDKLHPAFNALDLELATRSEFASENEGDAFALDIVNQTWGQQDFGFESDYLDMLAVHYGAEMRVVDFVNDFDAIREQINAWVEAQTDDRIEDLLPEGVLDETTRFILVNAIYFYGSWRSPFNEELTKDEPFTLLSGQTVDVPLMRQSDMFGFFEDDTTVAASIPYVGDQVSLIAFMPADENADFPAWEADFSRDDFDAVASAVRGVQNGRVTFPRFESEGEFKLSDTFKAMGMVDAFDKCDADFGGITGADPCIDFVSLYISEVLHKSFVSVDEEGTEAAAATAVIFATPPSAPLDPPDVRFDRPFYYAVYDHGTETVLFLGRMVDPS